MVNKVNWNLFFSGKKIYEKKWISFFKVLAERRYLKCLLWFLKLWLITVVQHLFFCNVYLIYQYVNNCEWKTDYFNDGLIVPPLSMHVPNFCSIVTLLTLRVSPCSSTTTSEPVTFFLKRSTGYWKIKSLNEKAKITNSNQSRNPKKKKSIS